MTDEIQPDWLDMDTINIGTGPRTRNRYIVPLRGGNFETCQVWAFSKRDARRIARLQWGKDRVAWWSRIEYIGG